MRVIISYMARDDDGDGAMHTYTTHNAHTLDSHMLSSAHPHQHACMHACSPAPSAHTAMRHYIRSHHPHRTPQYTLHLHIPSAVQPHTHAHCNTPNTQHIATLHTQLRTACACHRDHDETGDKRQHRHTHHADRDHDDDGDV